MYLLDTNVVSALRVRREANEPVWNWASATETSTQFLSVISVLELERGTVQLERRDSAQGAILRAWLDDQVMPAFADRVIGIDSTIARLCARLHVPDRKPERDAFIAATALVRGYTVVTRNARDFQGAGVKLINPWND